jgi:tetratricopeptide (TPR) repeat protein
MAQTQKLTNLISKPGTYVLAIPTRRFALGKEALSLSETIGYIKGKAEALRTLGLCHVRLSQNHESQACFEQAFELFDALNDTGGKGYVYTGFGIVQRNLGNYKSALQLFFKSLELIQETKYAEVEPLVYYHWASPINISAIWNKL